MIAGVMENVKLKHSFVFLKIFIFFYHLLVEK